MSTRNPDASKTPDDPKTLMAAAPEGAAATETVLIS